MTVKPAPIPSIPEQTKRVAEAAFPKGNVYMQMRDEIGSLYQDDLFVDLYSDEGQPGWSPWRLALVTTLQFAENLSDRQAADAVRAWLDWKYALSLKLTDPGFHYSILSEFRARLVESEKSQILLDQTLSIFKEKGWLKARGQQRTDSTHVFATVHELNQVEVVGETFRCTLNILATVIPDWLRERMKAECVERYGERLDEYRLPKEKREREALVNLIGQDGQYLLECIDQEVDLRWLSEVPAVQILKQVWEQQYQVEEGQIRHRELKEMPPVREWMRSPFDPEARYGKKRHRHWIGYKVHLTETCDEDQPHLITQVETRPTIEQDNEATADIQNQLVKSELAPQQHLVDAGYVSAKLILESQEKHGIDLIGPVHVDPVGKPTRQELLMRRNFKSIGMPNRPLVRRDNLVLAGIRIKIASRSPSFALSLIPKPAWFVPAAPKVRKRRTADEPWCYVQKDAIMPSKLLGKDNRPRRSSKSTESGASLKVRYPKQSAIAVCAVPAMLAGQRTTYKILPLRWRRTSSARSIG